jgi:16S rRNA (guanine(966)-N(2))-methyltransferase RsmD
MGNIRIVGGYARGVELAELGDQAGVRPTIGRSREALFNALGDLTGARVLDLFAGSGALGLEAASRGAASVMLVELERSRLSVIEANVAKVLKTGCAARIELKNADATCPERYLAGEKFDLVLADPPYADSFAAFSKLATGRGDALFPAFPRARVVWELPDAPGSAGNFIEHAENAGASWRLRRFGGTDFLWMN